LFNAARRSKISLFRLPFKMPVEFIYLGLTIYLLNGGGQNRSSTSILVLIGGMVMYFVMEAFRARPRLVPAISIALVCAVGLAQAAAFVLLDKSLLAIVAESQGKDPTLAGRTDLWRDVLKLGSEHYVLGAGYGGFWTPETKEYLKSIPRHSWGPQQSHNGYIETYVQLGIVGLILLLWVALNGLRGAMRRLATDFDYSRLRLVLLIATLVHNSSEAGFPRPTHLVWFTFLVVAINALPLKQFKRSGQIDTSGFARTTQSVGAI
jgi:exopolysaccharide production protein ExoQ